MTAGALSLSVSLSLKKKKLETSLTALLNCSASSAVSGPFTHSTLHAWSTLKATSYAEFLILSPRRTSPRFSAEGTIFSGLQKGRE